VWLKQYSTCFASTKTWVQHSNPSSTKKIHIYIYNFKWHQKT
jgi:hypothetical protein